LLRAATITCALLLSARGSAASPGSFVYVAASSCDAFSICTLNLFVYDATTSALVTTIPIATGRNASSLGIAISPDGSRVYVSVSVGASPAVVVVDATRHRAIGTVGGAPEGKLAVSRDGKLLFIGLPSGLYIYDTITLQLIKSIATRVNVLAADPAQDRVYWTEGVLSAAISVSSTCTTRPWAPAWPPTRLLNSRSFGAISSCRGTTAVYI